MVYRIACGDDDKDSGSKTKVKGVKTVVLLIYVGQHRTDVVVLDDDECYFNCIILWSVSHVMQTNRQDELSLSCHAVENKLHINSSVN